MHSQSINQKKKDVQVKNKIKKYKAFKAQLNENLPKKTTKKRKNL